VDKLIEELAKANLLIKYFKRSNDNFDITPPTLIITQGKWEI
jgi:hypothetical protein